MAGERAFYCQAGNFRKMTKNVYRGKQKISNPSNYNTAYCLHLQSLTYTFPCIYGLKLKTIHDQSSAELAMTIFFKQCVTSSRGQSTKYFGICMLRISPIAGVHCKFVSV